MIDVLVKGIGIGFAIAAPVGPIGLLCIRRTLVDGRAAGLATGLGAATADATYGLLVAAGFAATGVLVLYADPLAVGGGTLIAILGLLSLRSFFKATPAPVTQNGQRSAGLVSAWFTTFVLTLSNPMTIVAFIGMIAALGSAGSGNPTAPYWLVFGVFTGSALWWLLLVHLALAIRDRMTTRALRGLDLAVGVLLLVWGGWIALSALA